MARNQKGPGQARGGAKGRSASGRPRKAADASGPAERNPGQRNLGQRRDDPDESGENLSAQTTGRLGNRPARAKGEPSGSSGRLQGSGGAGIGRQTGQGRDPTRGRAPRGGNRAYPAAGA